MSDMNVLMLGNGFDIYHKLPTKYCNFLHVVNFLNSNYTGEMRTIEDVLGNDKLQTEDKYIKECCDRHHETYKNLYLLHIFVLYLLMYLNIILHFLHFLNYIFDILLSFSLIYLYLFALPFSYYYIIRCFFINDFFRTLSCSLQVPLLLREAVHCSMMRGNLRLSGGP